MNLKLSFQLIIFQFPSTNSYLFFAFVVIFVWAEYDRHSVTETNPLSSSSVFNVIPKTVLTPHFYYFSFFSCCNPRTWWSHNPYHRIVSINNNLSRRKGVQIIHFSNSVINFVIELTYLGHLSCHSHNPQMFNLQLIVNPI